MTTPNHDWADLAAKEIWVNIENFTRSRIPIAAAIIRRHAKERENAVVVALTNVMKFLSAKAGGE